MCGISGLIGTSFTEMKELINVMNKALSHRGPDDEGYFFSSEGDHVALGHRRLSIIDPEGGKQPLCNEDGSVWITFNGCIYNYMELAQTLRQKGHRFKTHTDTEVIVHAYEEYGQECVKKFIGMFAFAIWDTKKKELFCARDRIGIKPFYFWRRDNTFLFASEIKALLSTRMFTPDVNTHGVQEYLIFQASLSDQTIFKDVYQLMPGHCMIVDTDGKISKRWQYWDLKFEPQIEQNETYLADQLRFFLEDSVKIRMRSDVPLGCHLSGGIDSSTVACLASKLNFGGESIKTFNGAFAEGSAFDESHYARLVVEQISSEFYQVIPSAQDFIETINKIIFFMDQPAAGPGVFPQYMVSKMASQHVKVVLGGQGGDEIFAGYARYLLGYLEECLRGAIFKTADIQKYAATLSSIIPSLPMLQQYIPMLKTFWSDGLFDGQSDRYFRLLDRSVGSREIFCDDLFEDSNDLRDRFDKIFTNSDSKSFLNRMLYFDVKVHLPALLHVEDRTSMAWGLESRVPLLDHRICEMLAQIPVNIKFRNGQPKYLFRKAVTHIVPDKILNREDKMGFPVPLHKWYRNELKDFVMDILLDSRARQRGIFNIKQLEKMITQEKSFGRAIWGALSLEIWFKTFMDGREFGC